MTKKTTDTETPAPVEPVELANPPAPAEPAAPEPEAPSEAPSPNNEPETPVRDDPQPSDTGMDTELKGWLRANIHWVMAEMDYTRSGLSAEERAKANP